jgi:hypothetical protein
VDTVTYRAARARQLVGVGFGLVMLLIGIAIEPKLAGWVAIAIGVIGLVAGLGGIVPGAAYVRFSSDGLTVKYAFLPAHTVAWREIAEVESRLVPLIRHKVPSLVLAYEPGFTGRRVGQHLDGEHTYVANFTLEKTEDLAAKANEYRARYGSGEIETAEPESEPEG